MIKGINKQVLEITETNSGYFEKALFFIKPEYSGYSENKLREIAQTELKNSAHPPKQKNSVASDKFRNILFLSITFLVGGAIGFLISFLV